MEDQLKNLLLNALSSPSRDRLLKRASAVPLPARAVLYEPEREPHSAYFLTSGVASVVATVEEGESVEVGLTGVEGVVAGLHLLGPGCVPTRCLMLTTGTALRIPFAELQRAYSQLEEIRDRILEFVQAQALIGSQIAACYRLHEAAQRLARWLLMVRDRLHSDELNFTQEFLAEMLGTRRATITLVTGALQRDGLIEYSRGRVRILDRERLEGVACACYHVIRDLNARLYTRPVTGNRIAPNCDEPIGAITS